VIFVVVVVGDFDIKVSDFVCKVVFGIWMMILRVLDEVSNGVVVVGLM